MTCRTFVQFLDRYVTGELPADVRATFDRHVARCVDCLHYLHGYVTAGEALRAALCLDDHVPKDVPRDLVAAILDATRERRW